MISVPEADRLVGAHRPDWGVESVPVSEAGGRILRETVETDRPQPPYDRVIMDGIAVAWQAVERGVRRFEVEGTVLAGTERISLRQPAGACLRVMTGAVLPEGADTVIPVEEITGTDGFLEINEAFSRPPDGYVHRRGTDQPAGATLLRPGDRLGVPEIAAAAGVGRAVLEVARFPRITVISTGDELVEPGQPLASHQIRASNAHAILAALYGVGCRWLKRLHLPDDRRLIQEKLARRLTQCDLLVTTGAVSRGDTDCLPEVWAELGVREIFHRVSQRPGKPLWFGVSDLGTVVFGLPGNPVSALVCLHRYLLPMLAGSEAPRPRVPLAEPVAFDLPLTLFRPARWVETPDGPTVRVIQPSTSGDFSALCGSDGFVELDAGTDAFPKGGRVPFYNW